MHFFLQPAPEGGWENDVTIRSTRWARMYHPGLWVDRVSPTPMMMIVAKHDHIAATDLALGAYERALEPKGPVLIEGGHLAGLDRMVHRKPLKHLTDERLVINALAED